MNDYIIIGTLILVIFIISFKLINGYEIVSYLNTFNVQYENNRQEFHKAELPWRQTLRNNYTIIRDEYVEYTKHNKLERAKNLDKSQAYIDTSDIPWDIVCLRIYNKDTNKIKYFSKTYEFISNIPGCTLAMFSVLHPSKIIPPHNGIYNGVLRYHLGLITPKDNTNCILVVNNIIYQWKEGEDVMFDDTFTHSVINSSNETRVVLLLDIQKEFNNLFLNSLNKLVLYLSQFNDTVKDFVDNVNHS
jgi:aspartyl/asparaginyl beta-hydroxylase (cupin superfamily)